MTELETAAAPEAARPDPWPGWETVIAAAGVLLSIVATVLTAILELSLSSLRTGSFAAVLNGDSPFEGTGTALPVAAVVAVGANVAIGWFAVTTIGRRGAIGLPWALWTLIMLMASGSRSAEGDYLLTDANWVAVVTILTGSLSFAVYAYKLVLRPPTDSGLPGGVQ